MDAAPDIIDLPGISRLFQVEPATVLRWRTRQLLPEPNGYVSGAPWWIRDRIMVWGEATGRWNPVTNTPRGGDPRKRPRAAGARSAA
jgi:hypothetical protein